MTLRVVLITVIPTNVEIHRAAYEVDSRVRGNDLNRVLEPPLNNTDFSIKKIFKFMIVVQLLY
jgi:hypothetical protein